MVYQPYPPPVAHPQPYYAAHPYPQHQVTQYQDTSSFIATHPPMAAPQVAVAQAHSEAVPADFAASQEKNNLLLQLTDKISQLSTKMGTFEN